MSTTGWTFIDWTHPEWIAGRADSCNTDPTMPFPSASVMLGPRQASKLVFVYNFGFTSAPGPFYVPDDAEITRIKARVRSKAHRNGDPTTSANVVVTDVLRLLRPPRGGNPFGVPSKNRPGGSQWELTCDEYSFFNGTLRQWGLPLTKDPVTDTRSRLKGSDVTKSTFGVFFRCKNPSRTESEQCWVDSVKIHIRYTDSSGSSVDVPGNVAGSAEQLR
jgi:hypothetical protein